MAVADLAIILDLATDSSASIVSQLIKSVQSKVSGITCHKKRHELINNVGRDPSILVMAKNNCNFEDVPSLTSYELIVSDDCLDLLFKAKTRLDESPGFGCDIQVVTTAVMKKFWEAACLHVFSPVTTWSVWGVPVVDQAVTLREPVAVSQVQNAFRDYLKTVGDPDQVNIWRSEVIPADQFNAGFHDRKGGVSQLGPLASMNMVYTLHKPDSLLVIEENRRRLGQAAGFDPTTMFVTKAEHAKTIWVVGQDQPAKYDGIVTDRPGVTLCAAGADCCMILLADTHTGAIGAVHSGWKGTAIGAVKALLHAMTREYGTQPVNVRAAIGPSISGAHYDMAPENARPIADLDTAVSWPSREKPDRVHVSLVKANEIMLEKEGVPASQIDTSCALCTLENTNFFSHRRDGLPFGNQVGFISRRLPRLVQNDQQN